MGWQDESAMWNDEQDEDAEECGEVFPFGQPRRPTAKEIREENEMMQRHQEHFRIAADCLATGLAQLTIVQKVAIIGSVASPLEKEVPRFREYRRYGIEILHECSDLDLAVWIGDLSDLKALQKVRSRTLNDLLAERNVRVAHHQVEMFLLEPGTDRYLGRLCEFGQCPKGKPECLVPSCGATRFLQQHRSFRFHPWALEPGKSIVLFDRQCAP